MIPRETIVRDLLHGLGLPGVTGWPNVAVGYDATLKPYEYNLTKAIEHMEAAGFELVYSTLPSPNPTYEIRIVFCVGIALFVSSLSIISFLKRRRGKIAIFK
ncbi:hypothetical protein JW865_09160 [Candidatus Bathyarchaeota archaeon]|nr:hypothetical protein [Candidatus Bathyarchaeota archaeon]